MVLGWSLAKDGHQIMIDVQRHNESQVQKSDRAPQEGSNSGFTYRPLVPNKNDNS